MVKMGLITEVWDTTVVYRGRRYRTHTAYDTVLAVQQLYREEELSDLDKATQALKMFLHHSFRIRWMKASYRFGLLEEIFEQQIKVGVGHPAPPGHSRLVDFELDGEYIYAAFLQDYGMDLIEQQGKLHWKKFLALFQGLSDDTRIRQIMRIRGMKEPAPTKYNQEQIQQIRELKSYYALPVQGGGGQSGLNSLFDTLERLAR